MVCVIIYIFTHVYTYVDMYTYRIATGMSYNPQDMVTLYPSPLLRTEDRPNITKSASKWIDDMEFMLRKAELCVKA